MNVKQAEDLLHRKKIVFLVGAPRSGTTWLQLLMSRSPQVATTQETHLYDLFLRSMFDQWDRLERTGEKIGLNQVLSRQEFIQLLRDVSTLVLAKIAEKKPAAHVILEKTPNHVNCWREILEIWPDAHFIHIIRDPRSVVASMRVASRTWASHWASPRASVNCVRWISDVSSGLEIPSTTPNYYELFFQDLLSDGPSALRDVLAAIGVESDPNECEQYVQECNIENLKQGKLSNAPFAVARMNPESFRLGRVDSWRWELSTWEIAKIEHIAKPLMAKLGFDPVIRSKLITAVLNLESTVISAKRLTARWFASPAEKH